MYKLMYNHDFRIYASRILLKTPLTVSCPSHGCTSVCTSICTYNYDQNSKFPTTTHFSTIYEMHPLKSIYAGSRIPPLSSLASVQRFKECVRVYVPVLYRFVFRQVTLSLGIFFYKIQSVSRKKISITFSILYGFRLAYNL